MRTVDERIADVEGQARLYPQMFGALRDDISQVRGELRTEVGQLRGEVSQLRTEVRAEIGQLRGEMGQLRTEVRAEVGQLRTEVRAEIGQLRGEMGQGFARLDDRMSRQFTWMVGIQVTTLLAVVGALLARG
jgi:chromosome segregation ATPase